MTTAGRPLRSVALLAVLGASLAGCLDITATLSDAGSGDLRLLVTGIDTAQAASVTESLRSPHFELIEQSFVAGTGRYHVSVSDVTKLRTASLFRNVRVKRTRAGQRETLLITMPRNPPPPAKDAKAQKKLDEIVFSLHLTLPGEIVATNADNHAGSVAHWSFEARRLVGPGEVGMKVVYDIAAPTPAATVAATPAPTAGGAALTPTAAAAANPTP